MADDNVEQYILQISADQSAVQQTVASIQSVDDALAGVTAQAGELDDMLKPLTGNFNSVEEAARALWGEPLAQLPEVIDKTEQLAQDNETLAGSYDRVAQAAGQARDEQGRFVASGDTSGDPGGDTGGGGDGFSLPSARVFSTAGRLLGSQAGGHDVAEIGSLVRLTAAFGPFGAALGVGLIAINQVTGAEQARAKAAQDSADALDKLVGGAAGGTTDSITKQIDAQQKVLDAQNAASFSLAAYKQNLVDLDTQYNAGGLTLADYAQKQEDYAQQIKDASGGTVDYTQKINDAAEALKNTPLDSPDLPNKFQALSLVSKDLQSNLGGAIDGLTVKIDTSKSALTGLHFELGTGAVAANNDAAAQAALAKQQEAGAAQALQIDQLNSEQLKERAASDQRQVDVLTRYLGANNLNAEAAQNVANQITALNQDYALVTSASGTYGEQLKAEADAKQALTDQTTTYLDSITAEVKVRDQLAQDTQTLNQIIADSGAQAAQDLINEQSKIADIQTQGAERRKEIEQSYQDSVAQIDRQAAYDETNAIGDRSALALTQAQDKQQLDLTNQAQQEARQLAQEQQSEADQEKSAEQSYQKQEQQLQLSLSKQEAAQEQKLQQDQVDLTNTLVGELALATNGATAQLQVHVNWWNTLSGLTAQGVALVTQQYESLFTNLAAITHGVGSIAAPISGDIIGIGTPRTTGQFNATLMNHVLRALDLAMPEGR